MLPLEGLQILSLVRELRSCMPHGAAKKFNNKEEIQMENKHMKRCSTSYIIREMQIKTVMKYNYTPKSATLTLPNAAKDVGATGILFHCWWECKMI